MDNTTSAIRTGNQGTSIDRRCGDDTLRLPSPVKFAKTREGNYQVRHSRARHTAQKQRNPAHSTTYSRMHRIFNRNLFFVIFHPSFFPYLRLYASLLFFFFCSTFKRSALLMRGRTPPKAMVARIRLSSSSSPRMASWRWRGVIRFTFRSLAALPASSSTSAVRYSRTAVTYTAAS